MSKCEICGKEGYHKLSCPTQKVTMFLSDVKVEGVTAESEGVRGKHEGATIRLMRQRRCNAHVWRKDYLNGGKKCQVCGKAQEEVKRSKNVEE